MEKYELFQKLKKDCKFINELNFENSEDEYQEILKIIESFPYDILILKKLYNNDFDYDYNTFSNYEPIIKLLDFLGSEKLNEFLTVLKLHTIYIINDNFNDNIINEYNNIIIIYDEYYNNYSYEDDYEDDSTEYNKNVAKTLARYGYINSFYYYFNKSENLKKYLKEGFISCSTYGKLNLLKSIYNKFIDINIFKNNKSLKKEKKTFYNTQKSEGESGDESDKESDDKNEGESGDESDDKSDDESEGESDKDEEDEEEEEDDEEYNYKADDIKYHLLFTASLESVKNNHLNIFKWIEKKYTITDKILTDLAKDSILYNNINIFKYIMRKYGDTVFFSGFFSNVCKESKEKSTNIKSIKFLMDYINKNYRDFKIDDYNLSEILYFDMNDDIYGLILNNIKNINYFVDIIRSLLDKNINCIKIEMILNKIYSIENVNIEEYYQPFENKFMKSNDLDINKFIYNVIKNSYKIKSVVIKCFDNSSSLDLIKWLIELEINNIKIISVSHINSKFLNILENFTNKNMPHFNSSVKDEKNMEFMIMIKYFYEIIENVNGNFDILKVINLISNDSRFLRTLEWIIVIFYDYNNQNKTFNEDLYDIEEFEENEKNKVLKKNEKNRVSSQNKFYIERNIFPPLSKQEKEKLKKDEDDRKEKEDKQEKEIERQKEEKNNILNLKINWNLDKKIISTYDKNVVDNIAKNFVKTNFLQIKVDKKYKFSYFTILKYFKKSCGHPYNLDIITVYIDLNVIKFLDFLDGFFIDINKNLEKTFHYYDGDYYKREYICTERMFNNISKTINNIKNISNFSKSNTINNILEKIIDNINLNLINYNTLTFLFENLSNGPDLFLVKLGDKKLIDFNNIKLIYHFVDKYSRHIKDKIETNFLNIAINRTFDITTLFMNAGRTNDYENYKIYDSVLLSDLFLKNLFINLYKNIDSDEDKIILLVKNLIEYRIKGNFYLTEIIFTNTEIVKLLGKMFYRNNGLQNYLLNLKHDNNYFIPLLIKEQCDKIIIELYDKGEDLKEEEEEDEEDEDSDNSGKKYEKVENSKSGKKYDKKYGSANNSNSSNNGKVENIKSGKKYDTTEIYSETKNKNEVEDNSIELINFLSYFYAFDELDFIDYDINLYIDIILSSKNYYIITELFKTISPLNVNNIVSENQAIIYLYNNAREKNIKLFEYFPFSSTSNILLKKLFTYVIEEKGNYEILRWLVSYSTNYDFLFEYISELTLVYNYEIIQAIYSLKMTDFITKDLINNIFIFIIKNREFNSNVYIKYVKFILSLGDVLNITVNKEFILLINSRPIDYKLLEVLLETGQVDNKSIKKEYSRNTKLFGKYMI